VTRAAVFRTGGGRANGFRATPAGASDQVRC